MKGVPPVWIVSATRQNAAHFWIYTYLGRSLGAMPEELRPEAHVTFENGGADRKGLPEIYNRAIDEAPEDAVLVFVHDDVYIHDPFVAWRLARALEASDVVGLAGSSQSDVSQPSWALCFDPRTLDPLGWQSAPHIAFAGAVNHAAMDATRLPPGGPPLAPKFCYGPLESPVGLLDGLFLAAKARRLREAQVRFDEQFDFHLYDLDFSRTAAKAGLTLTTHPILCTHASGGDFGSAEWKAGARRYLAKWEGR